MEEEALKLADERARKLEAEKQSSDMHDAEATEGDNSIEAKSQSGEAKSQSGEAKSQSGEAKSQSGDAKSQSGEAKSQNGDAKDDSASNEGLFPPPPPLPPLQ